MIIKEILYIIGFYTVCVLFIGMGVWISWVNAQKVGSCQSACSDASCNDDGACKDSKKQLGWAATVSFIIGAGLGIIFFILSLIL